MVNGVTSQSNPYAAYYKAVAGTSVLYKNDIENMVNFINQKPMTKQPEMSVTEAIVGTLPFAAIFGGIQGYTTLKNNGITDENALKDFKNAKKAGSVKGFNWAETIKNVKAAHPYTSRTEALKAGLDVLKNDYNYVFKKNVIPNETRAPFGLSKLLDKIPGYTKLRSTGIGKAMGKTGAGWMAVIEGSVKMFSEVIPTFKELGFTAGMKQLAKSGTHVAAGAAGWVAGDALGSAIGSAIGTAICPGVGTAIGGFLGKFIGGVAGSAVANKVATNLTGKNELEIAQDAQLKEVTQQIEADPQTKLALAQQTLQTAESVLAQDPNNQDALIAKESALKIIQEFQNAQEQAQASLEQQIQQPVQQQTNGFTTMNGVPVVPGFNGYGYDMNVYSQAISKAYMPFAQQTQNPFNKQALA